MILDEEYADLTAVRVSSLVCARELSAAEVVDAALARLLWVDRAVRAFIACWEDAARRAAAEVDRRVADGESFPLAGVPLGVKAWERTASPQVSRLVAAGCIPIGVTSVPRRTTPWQTWGHTERGPTLNPWRADRSPGGSSAGSAAAVSASVVPLATASDGAGSTRIPAAWCGVVGIKVTNGRLPSRDTGGLTAFGPIARTVEDAARYASAVFGDDMTGYPTARSRRPVTAVWSATLGFADTDPPVAAVAWAAVDRLVNCGAIELQSHPVHLLNPEPAWRALRNPAGDHSTAQALRAENNHRLARIFDEVDLLLTPTTPGPPHGHSGPGKRMNTSLTWTFNLSGHPAASIPAGFTNEGCPVGLQLVARHREEAALFDVGRTLERLAPWPLPDIGKSR